MNILGYNYHEENESLTIEFTIDEDTDLYYRSLKFECWDIDYYSPDYTRKQNLGGIDDDFILDLLTRYLNENELPEQELL